MPTYIAFLGAGTDGALSATVSESPEQVEQAIRGRVDEPARLTREDNGEPIYVNPAGVAYFQRAIE
jgi:hypothetical protein